MKPTIDSRQVHAFAALARRGSFTLAAKDLYLTQSAVSHAMKALEEDIGCRLVDRVGRRVRLTSAGEQFLRHAENILREMQSARSEMSAHSQWGQGRLRVGASTTACEHILPPALREFRTSFPHCVIMIEPGDQSRQIELLRASLVDLAVMVEPAPADHVDLVCLPLFEDEICFLVAPQHPWVRSGGVPREAVAQETLIVDRKAGCVYRLVSEYFREEKVLLSNVIEPGSLDAIRELVKLGVGVGLGAPWIVRSELEKGTLVALPLGERRLVRRWTVAYWKGRRLGHAEESFVGLCGSVAEGLGLKGPRAVVA